MPDNGSASRRRRLAGELRRLRTYAGLTAADVADRLGWSGSKLSRIELHRTGVRPADLERLLAIYQIGDSHRRQLMALIQGPRGKGWWEAYSDTLPEEYAAYIGLEAEAVSASCWSPEVVAGLLQTEDYARALTNTHMGSTARTPPGEIQRMVEIRRRRQGLLNRDEPLQLAAVIDEAVLLRRYGTPDVMHAQLEWLIDLSRRPNVTVRVLPFAGAHPVGTGPFTILAFTPIHGAALNDIVYIELLSTQALYVEEDDESLTYEYRLAFERLTAESLDPDASRDLIATIARDRWSQGGG